MYGNLGEYYLGKEQKRRAESFLRKFLTLSREIGSTNYETIALINLAKLKVSSKEYIAAETFLQDALTIATGSASSENIISTLLELGKLFNTQSHPDRSLPRLEQAIAVAEKNHSSPYEQKAHQLMAETLEMKGDFERALTHWKLASNIREEILGSEKQKAITAIQIRSNVEKLENEKALLRKEIKVKSEEIERVAMELAEKTELIRSTHRRVRKIVKPIIARNGHAMHPELDELLLDLDRFAGGKERIISDEFQLVHRSILQKLSKNYPALSLTERKICMLLREGLSTKEMALMLKVSPQTIEEHRYQIRKKMKLKPRTSLPTVLAGM